MSTIHIYWHIAQLNHWREVVEAQLNKLINSGLYEAATTINAVILGEEEFQLPSKIETIRSPRLSLYEFPTLALLWEQAKAQNGTILYFHTKGVSKGKNQFLDNWRTIMESSLILNWERCLIKLENYSTVGVEFRSKPSWHYSGNFWWATQEYINSLPRPNYNNNRWDAEMWLLSNTPHNHKHSTVLQHGLDLYNNLIEPGFWEDYDDYLQKTLIAGSDNINVFGGLYEGGINLQQRPEEITTFIYKLKDSKIETLWEIGSASGGLAKLFQDLFQIKNLIIVDDNKHPKADLRHKILKQAKEFVGDSHSPECQKWLSQQPKPEVVIIDGDHSYNGAKLDIELCLGLVNKGTIIFLHDTIKVEDVKKVIIDLHNDQRLELILNIGDAGQMADGLGITAFMVK